MVHNTVIVSLLILSASTFPQAEAQNASAGLKCRGQSLGSSGALPSMIKKSAWKDQSTELACASPTDFCVQYTATIGGKSYTTGGCLKELIGVVNISITCPYTGAVFRQKIPFMGQGAGVDSEIYCCNTTSCNQCVSFKLLPQAPTPDASLTSSTTAARRHMNENLIQNRRAASFQCLSGTTAQDCTGTLLACLQTFNGSVATPAGCYDGSLNITCDGTKSVAASGTYSGKTVSCCNTTLCTGSGTSSPTTSTGTNTSSSATTSSQDVYICNNPLKQVTPLSTATLAILILVCVLTVAIGGSIDWFRRE